MFTHEKLALAEVTYFSRLRIAEDVFPKPAPAHCDRAHVITFVHSASSKNVE